MQPPVSLPWFARGTNRLYERGKRRPRISTQPGTGCLFENQKLDKLFTLCTYVPFPSMFVCLFSYLWTYPLPAPLKSGGQNPVPKKNPVCIML